MKHVVSTLATRDLNDIVLWIAEDNPQRALKVLQELRVMLRSIARDPMLYRLRPEIDEEVRAAVAGRHVILFRIDRETVLIERVVYGGRDLPSLYS